MKFPLKQSAVAIIAGIMAAILAPPVPMAPADWAVENFVLPDGERKGELIDLTRTPHLIEPLNALGPDEPDNEIAVMKGGQTAFTTLLQITAAYSVDRDPCDIMIVQPTDGALSDFNSQKLGRAIDLSRARGIDRGERTWGVKIAPQTSRSATASTTYEKKFGNSSIVLALATSSADLRSKTVKKALCDEIDEYPDDLNQQGDPLDMVAKRQTVFLRSGTWKRAYFSTPRIKGASKIERKYLAGDQRKWSVKCPGCADGRFVFEWKDPDDDRTPGLKFNKSFPYEAHYVPPCCGVVINAAQKYDVYKSGVWIATAPGPGKFKSYHFDSLSSPFVPWDDIAKEFRDAGENQTNLKTFTNLTLGLPFEQKGDAPDWEKLLARAGGYQEGHIPARGLIFVAGADVQHSGIWVEAVAYAPNAESWSILHRFFDGETTNHDGGAFAKLATFFETKFPDAFGNLREFDALAVDAGDGGRSNQVLAWCRLRNRAFAIKGMDGWARPAIGTPTKVDIDLAGHKVSSGGTIWPVGTWSLKSTWYDNLRKAGKKAGRETDPPGYVHFHGDVDARYMKQMTAEYLDPTITRGSPWKETGPNHLLDCRIYAMAMAEYLGLSRLTEPEWAELARQRGMAAETIAADLFSPAPLRVAAVAEAAPVAVPLDNARTSGWWGTR